MNKKHLEYNSCLKIDGVPILPPLMTSSRRKEMEYYKQLAVAVEERLKLLKDTNNKLNSTSNETLKNSSNFYNCGDHSYKLVFAEPQPQTNTKVKETSPNSSSDTDTQLVTTTSCPNQAIYLNNADLSSNLEIRNFASAPMLVRSNSYTLEQPSPLLQAQLEQQGLYESSKYTKKSCTGEAEKQVQDNIGGCGDNIAQTKIGVKRKLPMKYAVLNNYNGYSTPPSQKNEDNMVVNDMHKNDIVRNSADYIFISNKSTNKPHGRRKAKTIYRDTISVNLDSSDLSNDMDNQQDEANERSFMKKKLAGRAPVSNENFDQTGAFASNEVRIPMNAQYSIQNLFETIQNNHTMQMQKLMEQQKADQELLKQAFEKQQAVLLREIHKSYSMSRGRVDPVENPDTNPDPEIPELQNLDNEEVYDMETKDSGESQCGVDFIRTSEILLTESSELLKRANSSIDSYMESRCPSAKLSQECLSSVASSAAIVQGGGVQDDQPKDEQYEPNNTSVDASDVFYTPVDTPIKSNFDRDYKKSVECFGDLKIEDINEEPDGEKETAVQEDVQDNRSAASRRRTPDNESNSSGARRSFHRELFPDVEESELVDADLETQERAATVLCAAARSYLVRRLLRTQKVCSIKRAIRETLLCALKLHGDGGIRTADADLHRRLIQQLNAACHELHDIFFNTTIAERMRMISCDRDIMIGPYAQRARTASTGSAKYSLDCRGHFRHTSSKSLDKHAGDPQFGKFVNWRRT